MIQKHDIDRNHLRYFLLWTIPCLCYLFLVMVIAPQRGAAWFSDDGLFLKMSWDAAYGHGWDTMLPQAPSYLFNALLMKFGVNELLQFRIVNYSLCFIGAILFFVGLDSNTNRSNLVPLAVTASILVYLNSVECPNSLALHFFLVGLGCYFLALRVSSSRQTILLALSALALALCGFTHAAMVIAVFIIGTLICIFDPIARKSIFPYLLTSTLFCLWAWYINEVGLATLLRVPAYHETSLIELLKRIYLILKFLAVPLIYFVVIMWFSKKYSSNKTTVIQSILVFIPLFFVLASLISGIWKLHWKFPGAIDFHQIPGVIYYPLFFIIFSSIWATYGAFTKGEGFFWVNCRNFLGQWIKKNSFQTQNYKLFLAVVGFLLLPAGLAAGSNTAILVGLVYFAGPALGLALMVWSKQVISTKDTYLYGFAASWILVFLVFTLYYNHPAANPPINNDEVVLRQPHLSSIVETRQYQKSLGQLELLYQQNHCQDKLLITLDNIPTIYYIFQHPSPPNIGIVRPLYYFPSKEILELLQSSTHWCAIDITGTETKAGIDQNQGIDSREAVRNFLKSQSSQLYEVGVPSKNFVGVINFYVR